MLNLLRKIIGFDNPIRLIWHRLKGLLAAIRYGFPGRKMVCIGVTGTDGKTTSTHMIEHLLHSAGKKVAMISTVEFSINGKRQPNTSKKTTMSPFLTQKFLADCVKKKVDYVVIESSSHALHQSRLWGIPFSIATITNITHEHLDYHGTMEKYAAAKKILFQILERGARQKPSTRISNIPHQPAAILNSADTYYKLFNKTDVPLKIAYGLNQGDLRASNISYTKHGSDFELSYKDEKTHVHLPMTGSYNVENALAASGVAFACRLTFPQLKKGLESFEGVAGRMERIKSPKGFEVIVDFALTPAALEKLYSTLSQTAEGRIIGIIGSCGDRDREKRPEMGRIVASYCDLTIVTDEEPYSENPMTIMQAVLKGAKKVAKLDDNLLLIPDRREAMEYAIKNAKKADLVVVTGMGSFTTRTMNDGPMEWDDRIIAREFIAKFQ